MVASEERKIEARKSAAKEQEEKDHQSTKQGKGTDKKNEMA